MAVTPYKAVGFERDEIVTTDDFDQLQSNYQWINDNTPTARIYDNEGAPRELVPIIVAGRTLFTTSNSDKQTQRATINVAKAFGDKCHPHVTTGVVSAHQARVHCTVTGVGANNPLPGSKAFNIKINIAAEKPKNDKILKRIWVHWHAFGWNGRYI